MKKINMISLISVMIPSLALSADEIMHISGMHIKPFYLTTYGRGDYHVDIPNEDASSLSYSPFGSTNSSAQPLVLNLRYLNFFEKLVALQNTQNNKFLCIKISNRGYIWEDVYTKEGRIGVFKIDEYRDDVNSKNVRYQFSFFIGNDRFYLYGHKVDYFYLSSTDIPYTTFEYNKISQPPFPSPEELVVIFNLLLEQGHYFLAWSEFQKGCYRLSIEARLKKDIEKYTRRYIFEQDESACIKVNYWLTSFKGTEIEQQLETHRNHMHEKYQEKFQTLMNSTEAKTLSPFLKAELIRQLFEEEDNSF